MMSAMRSWHTRYTITHNLLLVMFITLQHTCSTLHYTALHHSTGVTADPLRGGNEGKFWFPSLTRGGARCIFGWRVTSSNESLMMIKQAPSNCSVSSFTCSNSISYFCDVTALVTTVLSLPPTPWQKWIVLLWPDSFAVCTFTFQVCFGSRFTPRRRSHCEVAVFCVLRPVSGV